MIALRQTAESSGDYCDGKPRRIRGTSCGDHHDGEPRLSIFFNNLVDIQLGAGHSAWIRFVFGIAGDVQAAQGAGDVRRQAQ